MEQYCVKRARKEDWGFNSQGNYYSYAAIMEHIMNDMAKQGWVVRSTCPCYESDCDNHDGGIIITFARDV